MVIDDEDSSEVWGGFRVARRAYPNKPLISEDDKSLVIEASHDGYKRIRRGVIHQRSWSFTSRSLVIQDRITGDFQTAEARFHLHPDVRIDQSHFSGYRLLLPSAPTKTVNFSVQGAKNVERVASQWHPRFGASVPNICIAIQFTGHDLTTRIEWGDL